MSPRLAVFLLVCAAQLAWVASAVWSGEARLEEGRLWRFRTAPVDPVDLVRGRYVRLAFQETSGPPLGEGAFQEGDTAYALLEEGPDAFARVSGVTRSAPAGDAHLEVRVREAGGGAVAFDLPVERFYLPEEKAPAAERLVRRHAGRTWALVRVHEGEATLLDVLVDGVPLADAAEEALREDVGRGEGG